MKNSILMRARPEIINLKTYQSARLNTLNDTDSIFLDAIECAFEPYIGANKLSRYPEKQPKRLSDILCKLYDISSQNLMITRGADEAIECIIKTFCIPYKDNIIICPPTFSMYEHSAKIHGIEISLVVKTPCIKTCTVHPIERRRVPPLHRWYQIC